MANRGEVEIIGSMLNVLKKGRLSKTKLIYACMMSGQQMNEYLIPLIANGILESEMTSPQTGQILSITDKGRKLLTLYNRISELNPTPNDTLSMAS